MRIAAFVPASHSLHKHIDEGVVYRLACSLANELVEALKTTFLCRYLQLEALRRRIQEGLNVVENWNSANTFILFGKGGGRRCTCCRSAWSTSTH